ncbi:MAG: hypothetical protein A2Y10_12415 [Planctomycetes bacterium GWF2_41_51]|nr:MAG: hypothetical protein A2Y10_12415 [Planctomycetes bacterium GWF2_41_51]
MIKLFELNYDDKEIRAVEEVLRSRWISMGPKVEEFEARFAAMVGRRHAIAVNSCTAALHLGMLLSGVGPGDEVIVPSLTFVATVNSILYTGGRPVFADITSEVDLTVSYEDIVKKTTDATKAIVVVHYAGFSCDMNRICDFAKARGIAVIEDACHGPGGIYLERPLGSLGDVSCYSFYSNKNIATAEGGMLLADKDEYAEKARLLRSHGMTSNTFHRKDNSSSYDVVALGYNYRMDEIRAALGLVQLSKLPASIKKRNMLAKRYIELLRKSPFIVVPFTNYQGLSPYYIFPLRITGFDRDELAAKLLDAGIQTSRHYPPVHKFAIYQSYGCQLPLTEKIFGELITLPLHDLMTERHVEYISETIIEITSSVN